MTPPTTPQAGGDGRPEPVLLPGGDLAVPGGLCAELAAALELLQAFVQGTPPPAACRSPRLSRTALVLLLASREAAVRHQHRQHQQACAAPTVTVLPPAQPAPLSDSEMITTRRAADIARCSQEWIRRLAADGRIRGMVTDRNVRLVHEGDVRDWAAGRKGMTRGNDTDADAGAAPDPGPAGGADAA